MNWPRLLVERVRGWARGREVDAAEDVEPEQPEVEVSVSADGVRTVSRTYKHGGTTIRVEHQVPDRLRHLYLPGGPGEPIRLYHGEFTVPTGSDPNSYVGDVQMQWTPRHPTLFATGVLQGSSGKRFADPAFLTPPDPVEMWVTPHVVALPGVPPIPEQPAASAPMVERAKDAGWLMQWLGPCDHGDPAVLDRVTFLLPNGWPSSDGTPICDPADLMRAWPGRLTVAHSVWTVTLDAEPGLNDTGFARDVREHSGYVVTHTGELRRTDGGTFTADEADAVLTTLRLCFSLVTSRTTPPLLPVGWSGGTAVWSRWTNQPVDTYGPPTRWTDRAFISAQVSALISAALDYCEDPSNQRVIRHAVSYLVTAVYDADAELGTAIPISGLQMLAYHRLVTETAVMTKAKFKSNETSTDAAIRQLLTGCSVDLTIPAGFSLLDAAADKIATKTKQPKRDGLGTTIYMRNTVIHAAPDTPEVWPLQAWGEAHLLTSHLLTLAILNMIGYGGTYHPIGLGASQHGSPVQVPWAPSPASP